MTNTTKWENILKNLPIKKKLFNSLMTLSTVGIIVSVIIVIFLVKTNLDYQYAIDNYGFSQGTIGKLGMEFNLQTTCMRDLFIADDESELNQTKDKLYEIDRKSVV